MDFHENELVGIYLNDLKTIEHIKSLHQNIILMQHPILGKVLVINNEIQHIEKYQVFYHEMLVHLPAAFIPTVETVLIIGGGSLFAAYEVLKYSSVKKIVLCDYDHLVIDLMQKHYQHAKDVINDPRFIYVEEEGTQFILQEKNKYDLIINDCFNLASLSEQNNTSYFDVLAAMNTCQGICTDIVYRHIFDKKIALGTLNYLLKHQFALSMVMVPEYPGVLHIETIWGKNININQNIKYPLNLIQQQKCSSGIEFPLNYYSPNNLPYYFYLPPYIKKELNL